MRKFVFTNERYLDIKQKDFDRLKKEMASLDREIEMLENEKHRQNETLGREQAAFHADCKKGATARTLCMYQDFFRYIHERIDEIELQIEAKLEQKEKLSALLVKLHHEIKALEEMKKEQYAAYQKEVSEESAKEIDAFIGFSIHEKAV